MKLDPNNNYKPDDFSPPDSGKLYSVDAVKNVQTFKKKEPVATHICSAEDCEYIAEKDGMCKEHYLRNLAGNTVYFPNQRATKLQQYLKWLERTRHQAVPLYIDGVDDVYVPLRPGEIAGFIGITHNGKSMLVKHVVREHEKNIIENERDGYIIVVDHELMMEMSAMNDMSTMLMSLGLDGFSEVDVIRGDSDIDWDELKPSIIKMVNGRVIRIAPSFFNAKWAMEMTVENVTELIVWMVTGGLTGKPINVELLVVDYLQAIPADPKDKKYSDNITQQIGANFERLFVLCGMLQAPGIVAMQGRLRLNEPPTMYVPLATDIHNCSQPGQRASRIVSVWMPKTTYDLGTVVTHKLSTLQEIKFPVSDELMVLYVRKQRIEGAPSNRRFFLKWNYATYFPTVVHYGAETAPPTYQGKKKPDWEAHAAITGVEF